MPQRRRWVSAIWLVLWAAVCLEAISWIASGRLARKGFLLVPVEVDLEGYENYLEYRDPVLGWPGLGFSEGRDSTGARLTPAFPDPEASLSCVTLFGDSYTWGAEVSAAEAWGNVLSSLLGCRVANFGMGGYGTDQAYLRFRNQARDDSSIVVLGHFSRDILRNLNQYRGFLNRRLGGFSFKPRFVLEPDGSLQLVPLPELTADEFANLLERPDEYLPYDYFRPGGPGGITLLRFPYTFAVLRLFTHYSVRARLRGMASHEPFYRREHRSGALALTVRIVRAFHEEAGRRGQTPVVLVLPALSDLVVLQKTGELPYASLVEDLFQAGIAVPPLGEEILQHLGGKPPRDLFEPYVHFNAKGNELLARLVFDWLQDQGLWPQSPR